MKIRLPHEKKNKRNMTLNYQKNKGLKINRKKTSISKKNKKHDST